MYNFLVIVFNLAIAIVSLFNSNHFSIEEKLSLSIVWLIGNIIIIGLENNNK